MYIPCVFQTVVSRLCLKPRYLIFLVFKGKDLVSCCPLAILTKAYCLLIYVALRVKPHWFSKSDVMGTHPQCGSPVLEVPGMGSGPPFSMVVISFSFVVSHVGCSVPNHLSALLPFTMRSLYDYLQKLWPFRLQVAFRVSHIHRDVIWVCSCDSVSSGSFYFIRLPWSIETPIFKSNDLKTFPGLGSMMLLLNY